MADLTATERSGALTVSPPARTGRGQLLLTGGLVIALLLVSLSLVLNSAIYAENLGARGSGNGDSHAAVQYRADVGSMTGRTLQHVNRHHNSNYTTLNRALGRDVSAWSDLSGRHEAVTGGTVNASLRETTPGARVRQTATDRNLTATDRQSNWTLVDGTTDVRAFDLSLEPASLSEPSSTNTTRNLTGAGVFRIAVETDTTTRRVFVYRNDSEFVVATASASGPLGDTCEETAGSDENVEVNLTGATVAGSPCPELSFFANVTGPRTIGYEDAPNATGSYSLVVETADGSVPGANYEDEPTAEGPYVVEMLYSADVQLTYVTSRTTYRTTVSAVPGGDGR